MLAGRERGCAGDAYRRERLGVEEAQAAAAGTLSPEGLRLGRAYDRALATAEAAWNARADATRAALAAKREELVRARWEERKLGRLEQQHRVRVAEEEAQADARTLDELAMARHARAERK